MRKSETGQKSGRTNLNSRNTVLLRSASTPANVFESTVEKLGQSIKMGFFRPGQQLPPERELAEISGVSRVTIRSAIQVLSAGGFLRVQRGRTGGTFVVDNPPVWPGAAGNTPVGDIKSAYDILDRRLVVESGVSMLAAKRIGKTELSNLRELVGRLGELVGSLSEFRAVDAELHIAIAEATGNQSLIKMTAELEAEVGGLIHMIPRSREALIHSNQQHAQIVSCLSNKDADGARTAMWDHLEGTRQLLAGLLPTEKLNRT